MKLEQLSVLVLNEQIDNMNFKNWFGKSKMVYPNGHEKEGQPMEFYHGTNHDFDAFSHEHVGKGTDAYGSGFYFTNNPEVASSYASSDSDGGNVKKVHLRITKPIDPEDDKPFTRTQIHKMITSAPNHVDSLSNYGDVNYHGYRRVLDGAVDSYASLPKFHAMNALGNDFYSDDPGALLKNLVRHTGHDGVIVKNGDTIIANAFTPNQIKSAISNNGAYSKKSDKLSESVNIESEEWLHVENRKKQLPIDHVRDIVAEHKKLGYTIDPDDERIINTAKLGTYRDSPGSFRAITMCNPEGSMVVLHTKFPTNPDTKTTQYKIKRETRHGL